MAVAPGSRWPAPEGAAQAQKIVRSALSGSYLHYLWIKTLSENPNGIYVASEANLPIVESVDGKQAGLRPFAKRSSRSLELGRPRGDSRRPGRRDLPAPGRRRPGRTDP